MRFFIALMPPIKIQDYAEQVIQELGDRYHTRTAKAPPHITLQSPFEWRREDDRLERQLKDFADCQPPFAIELFGFGAFPPRVLYVNVQKKAELLALQSSLAAELKGLGIVDPQSRAYAPHLTVASRNLNPTTFDAAWQELKLRQIEFKFVTDALTLLIHDGHRWQIDRHFPFRQSET